MISSLQPQRPKPSQQHAHPSPIPYQQTRASTTSSSTTSPSSTSPLTYQPPTPQPPLSPTPRNQLEAMPPSSSSTTSQSGFGSSSSPLYNAATRHPVFFTSSLFKPPFPLPRMASQAGWSPVASGYVFEQRSARRKADGERTKL